MEDTIQILLLGPPDVLWEGQPLKITRRMTRALLYYLAVKGRVSRTDLRWLFWPDEEDEEKARANLRVALNRLRASLPDADVVEVTADAVDLMRQRVSVDVTRFYELSEPAMRTAAQISLETPLPEWAAQQLRLASELWRAPRFLPGFSFAEDSPDLDHWQGVTARQLEELYLRVQTRLADHYAAAGDLDAALGWIKEALEVDFWVDDLHLRALRWRIQLGHSSAAAGYARTLQTQYQEEGLELSPELGQLVEQALTNDQQPAQPESQGWPAALLAQVALIERTTELQMLQIAFRRGGVALVLGEAGAGKTRLAYEFHRFLRPHPRLLLMNCVQGEHNLPFQPLTDALRRSVRQEEWQQLKAAWYQEMAVLLPELAEPRSMVSSPVRLLPETQRGQIFEALRHLLQEIAHSVRLLVVLDGAQWCDEDTLAALAYLNERHFFIEHGLLLVLARSEEKGPVLEHWMAVQRSAPGYQQLLLPAFSQDETGELALRVLHRPLAAPVLQRLTEDTGGNPLFLLETLFALREVSPNTGLGPDAIRLPVGSSLHSLLRERLSRLQQPARQVAAAAAVLDAEFSPVMLSHITLLDADMVAQALDDLVEAQLAHVVLGSSQAAYAFNHGQIRQVIQWEQGAARLRLLHLRAARALEAEAAHGSQMDHAGLARHFELAGETLQAFQHCLLAGQQARLAFKGDEAIQSFQTAERLVQHLNSSLPVEDIYQLYNARGEIAFERGDLPAMQQIYAGLLRQGEERHSSLLVGSALGGLANLAFLQGDLTRARDTLKRGLYHLEQQPDLTVSVRCYSDFGWLLSVHSYCGEAVEVLEKAYALVQGSTDPHLQEVRILVEYRLGTAYGAYGQPLRAQELATNLLRQVKSPALMYGNLTMASVKYYLGDLRALLEHTRFGLKLCEELGAQSIIPFMLTYQMRAELTLGQLDAVWEHTRTALKALEERQSSVGKSFFLTLRGDAYRLIANIPMAISHYQEALATGRFKWDTFSAQYRLGLALADGGQVEEGLHLVEDVVQKARRFEMASIYIPAENAHALLLTRMGRLDDALKVIYEGKKGVYNRHFLNTGVVEDWVMSQEARQRGDQTAALLYIESSILEARRIGDPFAELDGFRLYQPWGLPNAQSVRRVGELLEQIELSGRHYDLRDMVQAFVARARSQIFDGSKTHAE